MKHNNSMAKKGVVLTIIQQEVLINKICFLRNEKIMLDRDLALLYGVNISKKNASQNCEAFFLS